jgi:hypothetical protein
MSVLRNSSGGGTTCVAVGAGAAKAAMPAGWSVEDAVFDGLAQDRDHMPPELRPFIQEKHTMTSQLILA